MPTPRPAHPLLHLHRINVPWVNTLGTLLLATPRRRAPREDQDGWQKGILDALHGLQNKMVFQLASENQVVDRLGPYPARKGTSGGDTLTWSGWESLILPSEWRSCEVPDQEAAQIDYLPVAPADPLDWDQGFQWAVEGVVPGLLKQLQRGRGAIYFCPEGMATAGLLPALLSLLGDPMVHPHKVVYPLGASGLGLTPYQRGILLGLSLGEWRAKFSQSGPSGSEKVAPSSTLSFRAARPGSPPTPASFSAVPRGGWCDCRRGRWDLLRHGPVGAR